MGVDVVSDKLKQHARRLRTDQTATEKRLWAELRKYKPAGHHFRRQVVFDRYIVDFACHSAKLVIELDGDSHGGDEAQARDRKRDTDLARMGYQVLRFWNWEVSEDLQGVMYKIEHYLPPTPDPSPPGGGE